MRINCNDDSVFSKLIFYRENIKYLLGDFYNCVFFLIFCGYLGLKQLINEILSVKLIG